MIVIDVRTISINGKKLTFFRRRAKLTLEKLAHALDMSQSRVFKITKKDNVAVFLETAQKLKEVLTLSDDEFKEIQVEVPAPAFTPSKYAGDPGALLRYKLQELVREGLTADEIIDEAMRMKGKK